MKVVKVLWFVILFAMVMPLTAQNLLLDGGMENEDAWQVVYYNEFLQPDYEFNYAADSFAVASDRGGALRVILEDGQDGGQLLLYQRVECVAGQTYKASALIKVIDYFGDPDQLGQWFQFYVTTEEPDPEATDFNPGGAKMFNMSSWDGDMDAAWFDMNGYWEDVKMTSEIETAPYWVCPGEEGEQVMVTVGIKFGSSAVPGAFFDLIVDDVAFYEMEMANYLAGSDMSDESAWNVAYYNEDMMPEYAFVESPYDTVSYLDDDVLWISLPDVATGQLLFYQRLSLPAGSSFRASGTIHLVDYFASFEPVGQGPWYQFYVTTEEPDLDASDFNPGGAKMFDISAWDEGCSMAEFWQFQGFWEQVRCLSEIETAPYFVVPGEPGEMVDVTVGIKFGHWANEPGFFEVYVDNIEFLMHEEMVDTGVETEPVSAPADFVLEQNYPNPFNPTTTISYSLETSRQVTLAVYDLLGHKVRTLYAGHQSAGRHHIQWDGLTDAGQPVSSGVYLYRMSSDTRTETRKMMFIQ